MKTNGTRIILVSIFLQLLLLVLSFTVQAKPDYDFSNGSLISGTDGQIGATYRYTSVRPLVDAIVVITDLTGGVTLTQTDGTASGFKEAFQPVINIPGHSKGYAEFKVTFVIAGTNIPAIMLEVPITCIDVDGAKLGSGNVYEFDQIEMGLSLNSYIDFNMLGGQLNVNIGGGNGWATGTNTAAIDYAGVDTVVRQAMFTTVMGAVSTIIFRNGADNQSNGVQQRLRSVYFQKFSYQNSFLAQPSLLSFRGNERDKKVQLQFQMTTDTKVSNVIIERATSPNQFASIGQVWVNADGALQTSFNFTDNTPVSGQAYYRLKMTLPNGTVQYSNILAFRVAEQNAQPFKLYPSAIQSSVTVNVRADKSGTAVFQLVDYSGRVLNQQTISVQEGDNNVMVNNLGNINTGTYVAMLRMDNNKTYNQKVVKM